MADPFSYPIGRNTPGRQKPPPKPGKAPVQRSNHGPALFPRHARNSLAALHKPIAALKIMKIETKSWFNPTTSAKKSFTVR